MLLPTKDAKIVGQQFLIKPLSGKKVTSEKLIWTELAWNVWAMLEALQANTIEAISKCIVFFFPTTNLSPGEVYFLRDFVYVFSAVHLGSIILWSSLFLPLLPLSFCLTFYPSFFFKEKKNSLPHHPTITSARNDRWIFWSNYARAVRLP